MWEPSEEPDMTIVFPLDSWFYGGDVIMLVGLEISPGRMT